MSQVTVWHDGGCPLCAREIAMMRRLDRRGAIAFVDATTQSYPLNQGRGWRGSTRAKAKDLCCRGQATLSTA